MAVGGLVILSCAEAVDAVRERLAAHPQLCEVQPIAGTCKTAVVLEANSAQVETLLAGILQWEGVLTADIAFLSYEDELEAGQEIQCPPHKARRHDGLA